MRLMCARARRTGAFLAVSARPPGLPCEYRSHFLFADVQGDSCAGYTVLSDTERNLAE